MEGTDGYDPRIYPTSARLDLSDLTGSSSAVAYDKVPMFYEQISHKWFGVEVAHLIRGIYVFYLSLTL